MNCSKCGCKLSIYGLKQHENKCKLNKDNVKIIINEYVNNYLSISNIKKKYKLSDSVIFRIIGDKIRSPSEATSLSHKKGLRKVSEETKRKISIGRKKYLDENKDKIKWPGNNSNASIKFKDILNKNNISFMEEFKPLENRFFRVDISFPDKKIGIEINGEQHYERNGNLKEYYQNRHNLIEAEGWKLYEISHYLIYKKEFLENLIIELKNNNLENIDYSFYIKEKKDKFCNCGSIILKESNVCIKCRNLLPKKRKVAERPTYEQLLKEIEETNYVQVGKKYGVTDNAIRKWIKMYEKYGINY